MPSAAEASPELVAASSHASIGRGSTWQAPATAAVLLWIAGALVVAGRAVRGMLVVRRFLATLAEAPPPPAAAVDEAFRRIGSDRRARVYVTRAAPAPFTLGLLRPIIIVPEYLAVDPEPERLHFALTHEVAHIARRDPWAVLVERLASILYWWNPLVRILSRQLSQAREEICDDYVLRAGGEGRKYAAALLDVAERTALVGLAGGTALLGDDAEALERRIRRLLQPRPRPTTELGGRTIPATMTFGVVLAAVVLATRVRIAESSPLVESSSPNAARSAAVAPRPASDHGADGGRIAAVRRGGETSTPAEEAFDPTGDWLLTLPAGFEHRVEIADLGRGRYRLTPPRLNMSGVYRRRGGTFDLVEPNDSRLTEFKWRFEGSDILRLVAEPPPGKTGAGYAGASLRRLDGAPYDRGRVNSERP
jgi:beta-lactamase regulating signal transducer with metallopeptidase domain